MKAILNVRLVGRTYMIKKHFLQLAAKIAASLDNGLRSQHCALIVRKNRVLSIGVNQRKTHPKMRRLAWGKNRHRNFLHAEISALIGASPEALKNATLYVARVTRAGNLANSKPCSLCRQAILSTKIKHVVFTINNRTYGVWLPREDKILTRRL